MKVLALNGSYNKKGVTWTAINLVAKELKKGRHRHRYPPYWR